jgi:hypothetical protein
VLAAIVDDGRPSAFVTRALAEIAALRGVRLAVVVSSVSSRAETVLASAVSQLVLAADRWRFAPSPELSTPPALTPALAQVPHVQCRDSDGLRRVVSEHGVEAILDLGETGVRLDADPPLGSWCFRHNGLSAPEAAINTVFGGEWCIRSALASRAEPSRVLAEAVSARDHVSAARTLNALQWKSVLLARRGIARLERERERAGHPSPDGTAAGSAPMPASTLLRRLPAHVTAAARNRRARMRAAARWSLLIGRRDGEDIAGIEPALPPPGRFWADPFIVADRSDHYVFFEEFRDDLARAHIAVAPLDQHGRLGPPMVALERPYHLSYPFVFTHAGEWFMVPETQANRTIEVYRCERFPHRWRFSHVLVPGIRAVDATLLPHGDRWWLFANVAELEGSSTHDELWAFWADNPLSTRWQPHRANPIVADVRRARPAGPFICHGRRLIRPSQDSSTQYGSAIQLNEVIALTETAYEERPIGIYKADWNPRVLAMHALSEHGGIVCLDGKVRSEPDPSRAARMDGRCRLRTAEAAR